MLSQLGTIQFSDQLLELLEWLFATKNIKYEGGGSLESSRII